MATADDKDYKHYIRQSWSRASTARSSIRGSAS